MPLCHRPPTVRVPYDPSPRPCACLDVFERCLFADAAEGVAEHVGEELIVRSGVLRSSAGQ